MRIHQDWSTAGFALDALAPAVGPFPYREFCRVWWHHRGGDAVLEIVETPDALLPLMRHADELSFVGDDDVTDYHSPLGSGAAAALAEYVSGLTSGTRIVLDSVPAEALPAIEGGLRRGGVEAVAIRHHATAVVDIAGGPDAWMATLDKKQRHEIRRKRRRFESALGPASLLRDTAAAAAGSFAAMHRMSGGEKGAFMDDTMEAFFVDLSREAGAVVDVLADGEGRATAMAIGFEDHDAYYLYNSAYDPGVADSSPGAVMVSLLIERAAAERKKAFDFLKGDERYKFQHGARARPLYEVDAVVGG